MEKLSYDDPGRPKILALDLDGTLLHYDGFKGRDEFGEALQGMAEELNILKENKWVIVIWTCRPDTPALREHLETEGIPFDYVNDHPWNGPDDPRKIHADVYADDKNIVFSGISSGFADRVMSHEPWWQQPWL
jgi:hypothetical protein